MYSIYPIIGNELGTLELVATSLQVGNQTILLMPSFHYNTRLQHVPMRETPFQCYYILLPSNHGMMLLRKLVGT
ncbi:hypothetical protein Hanom_Chr07g00599161 [Helianthus anomalus]